MPPQEDRSTTLNDDRPVSAQSSDVFPAVPTVPTTSAPRWRAKRVAHPSGELSKGNFQPARDLVTAKAADGLVLVCGGDGTVPVGLDIVDSIDWAGLGLARPRCSLLPQGTGNDVSRCLRLGTGFTKDRACRCCSVCCSCCQLGSIDEQFALSTGGTPGLIDRWELHVVKLTDRDPVVVPDASSPTVSGEGKDAAAEPGSKAPASPTEPFAPLPAGTEPAMAPPADEVAASAGGDPDAVPAPAPVVPRGTRIQWNNHFTLGVDAEISADFHAFRKRNPDWCKSRFMNKIHYTWIGAGKCCCYPALDTAVTMVVDGVAVPLPKGAQSVMVTNLDSFASGVQLWKDSRNRFQPISVCDGLLEVQTHFGINHMSGIQAGYRKATKVCQGSVIEFTVNAPNVFLQFDGEAIPGYTDDGYHVTLRRVGQTPILHHRPELCRPAGSTEPVAS